MDTTCDIRSFNDLKAALKDLGPGSIDLGEVAINIMEANHLKVCVDGKVVMEFLLIDDIIDAEPQTVVSIVSCPNGHDVNSISYLADIAIHSDWKLENPYMDAVKRGFSMFLNQREMM